MILKIVGFQLKLVSAYNKWIAILKTYLKVICQLVLGSGLDLATVSCEAVSYVGKWNEASKVMDAKKEHYYIVWRKEI